MSIMTGVVQEVSQKDVSTKFGTKPTYSFKMDGKWIKCGFKNPKVEVGYTVDFDATEGTYGIETKAVNIVSRSVPVGVSPVATSGPSRSIGSSGGYSREKVFPIPPLHGDRSIVRQNALSRAVDLFIASSGGKAFAVDVESVPKFVINLARKFEAYTAGDIDLEEAEAEMAVITASAALAKASS